MSAVNPISLRVATGPNAEQHMDGATPEYEAYMRTLMQWAEGGHKGKPKMKAPPGFWHWYMDGAFAGVMEAHPEEGTHHAWGPLGLLSTAMMFLPIPGARIAAMALKGVNAVADTVNAMNSHHAYGDGYIRVDPASVHAGSLGAKIDSMVGTCPIGAPTGFVLRKLEYKASPTTGSFFIASYRHTDRHLGTVVSGDGSTITYQSINGDAAVASANEYLAQKPQRVQDGDILIATILRVTDGRATTDKSGHFAAGVVPCVNPDPENSTHYGTFAGTPSTTVVGNSIGGSARVACSTVGKNVAIVHIAESDAFFRVVDRDTTTGSYKEDASTPIMAIVCEGYNSADASQFDVLMTTYALIGPRNEDHSHPGRTLTHSMKCFTDMIQESPLYIQ
jgi:hypothetical protein